MHEQKLDGQISENPSIFQNVLVNNRYYNFNQLTWHL